CLGSCAVIGRVVALRYAGQRRRHGDGMGRDAMQKIEPAKKPRWTACRWGHPLIPQIPAKLIKTGSLSPGMHLAQRQRMRKRVTGMRASGDTGSATST
ncbi:unnamed protein product, partial [Mycena citricolor]